MTVARRRDRPGGGLGVTAELPLKNASAAGAVLALIVEVREIRTETRFQQNRTPRWRW